MDPLEECNSAANYWLLAEESIGRIEFCRELLAQGLGFRPARSKIFQSAKIQGTLTLKDLYRIRLIFNI
jgi:hypothetical protein